MSPPPIDRRAATGLTGAALLSTALSGCGVLDWIKTPSASKTGPARTGSTRTGSASSADAAIGRGSVRIGLILPLTGSAGGGAAAASLRDAADLAMAEFQAPNLKILVRDDRGTADGAREAARAVVAEGAELILGPLFAPAVTEVAAVAAPAGVPVIAFSTDAAVARRGVYLLSFMPQSEVERIAEYMTDNGHRSVASLVPDTPYGSVVEGQFRSAAARRGLRLAGAERYPAGQPAAAVARLAPLFAGARPSIDALLVPDGGDGLPEVGEALAASGFNPRRVKPVGTGVWNDPRALRVPALAGGWFAAPEAAGFNAFAERYRGRFGSSPARIATLSYDAVSLAAALARQPARTRFADSTLESPAGFAGADGVFRFRPDGVNERALAVMEVRDGATVTVNPAPKTLGGSAA